MKHKLTHKQRIVGRTLGEPIRAVPSDRDAFDERVKFSLFAELFPEFMPNLTLAGAESFRRATGLYKTTFRFP